MNLQSSLYRERFAATLAHRPVDRCPIDLGGTPQSTIEMASSHDALAQYLGYSIEPLPWQVKMDSRILAHFDVDFRRVGNLVQFKTGREREVSAIVRIDAYGIRYQFDGLYWEVADAPLADATPDDIARYAFPSIDQMQDNLVAYATLARHLFDHSPYVIVGEHPVFGVLELACWLCGYERILSAMASDPDVIHLLFEKILAFQKSVIHAYYEQLGPFLHMTTSGDDFGSQKSLLMSPAMWREFVKPYLARRIACTREYTDAVFLHHSCGAVFDIIPDLIDIGVDVLNPIQPQAAGMQPDRLKAVFGAEMTFHGGLDTQVVLPSGDAGKIEEAVQRLLERMDPGKTGGYIFAPAHNLQPDVSPGAIAVMYSAVRRWFQ